MDKRILIEGGKVHGVGFRPLLLGKARRLGLARYEAENLFENGREVVDVSFGGDEKAVGDFVEFCRKSRPAAATVSRVREAEPPEKVLPIDVYDSILAAEQQNTVVRSGLEMISMQKETLGLQKETVGLLKESTQNLASFHRDTIQRFDVVDAKYGKIAENLERIIEGMREDRKEARKSTERIIEMIASMKYGGMVREEKQVYGISKRKK